MKRNLPRCLAVLVLSATLSPSIPSASADTVHFDQPTLDRWMYPFNGSGGARETGSVFGAAGEDGEGGQFDDRDAQVLLGFNLAGAGVPTGLGLANYQVTSVKLSVKISSGNQFRYDSTYDPRASYLPIDDPNHVADTDAGTPIELYGAGFRNGFTGLSYSGSTSAPLFGENAAFAPGTPFPIPGNTYANERVRNVYATDFDGSNAARDVSNSIKDGFETNPFAIGQTSSVAAGQLVPLDAVFEFTLNLSDPNVLAYVQNALNTGSLALILASLNPAEQEVSAGFPSFYFKESIFHDPEFGDLFAPQLDIVYQIIPEPSGIGLLALAGLAGAFHRNFPRRRRNS